MLLGKVKHRNKCLVARSELAARSHTDSFMKMVFEKLLVCKFAHFLGKMGLNELRAAVYSVDKRIDSWVLDFRATCKNSNSKNPHQHRHDMRTSNFTSFKKKNKPL